jgi:hypothetical protein
MTKKKWTKVIIDYPIRPHLKLNDLDKIPYYDENKIKLDSIKYERTEQYIAMEYIHPSSVLLVEILMIN